MRNHDVHMVEIILTVGRVHGMTRPGRDWVRPFSRGWRMLHEFIAVTRYTM